MNFTKTVLVDLIRNSKDQITPMLLNWFCEHVVEPQLAEFVIDFESMTKRTLYIITNDNNSPYNIVFDQEKGAFGLSCTISHSIEWYMGPYGSLIDTINNI